MSTSKKDPLYKFKQNKIFVLLKLYIQIPDTKVVLKRTYFIMFKLLGENKYIPTPEN